MTMTKTVTKTLFSVLLMVQLSAVHAQETQSSIQSKSKTMKLSQVEHIINGNEDKENTAIESCINTYFMACIKGDGNLLNQAFHPNCHLKHITGDDELYDVGLDHFISFLNNNGGMAILETKILDIEQFGPIA